MVLGKSIRERFLPAIISIIEILLFESLMSNLQLLHHTLLLNLRK